MAVPEVVAKYAPLVVLHRDEKLLPSSADRFVAHSELRWATGRALDGEPVPEAADGIEAARLGAASAIPYRHDGYAASALTRPLDDDAARLGDPPLQQGFFLRLRDESAVHGDGSTSPDASTYAGAASYYDFDREAKAITYWLFYAASTPPLGILRASEQIGQKARDEAGSPTAGGAPPELEAAVAAATLEEFRQAYPGLAAQAERQARPFGIDLNVVDRLRLVAESVRALLRADDVLHEGDWERVTVYLDEADPDRAPPVSVSFYRHTTNTVRAWADVRKEAETHPVVYAAIGSHASLPSPDYGYIDVGDPDGPRWRTWEPEDALVPTPERTWYGFGGAWGRVGRVPESTGPLGPGAHWKHAAPRPPARREGP